ncbi:hypothetical protein QJQ45_000438 [Haematococcus lacustris]|nr:hypothetical protein QJQ45_000438 [Haematococcus lacustris]
MAQSPQSLASPTALSRVRCLKCGKRGHIARDCKEPVSNNSSSSNGGSGGAASGGAGGGSEAPGTRGADKGGAAGSTTAGLSHANLMAMQAVPSDGAGGSGGAAKPHPSLAAEAKDAAMPRSSGLLRSERFWLASSGASHHITPDRSLLHDFQAVEQPVCCSLAPPVKGVLDLVHTDVCGPFHVASMGGYSYVVTFLDEYSGLSLVACVKAKSDVLGSGRKLKALRSDNGTEYINHEARAILASHGIQHQRSAPYSPEQDGSAERLNQTLIEKVAEAMATAEELSVKTPAAEPGLEPAPGGAGGEAVGADSAASADNRWVLSVKEDSNGHIARFKARLVVKGFMQREGVDLTELHAPPADYEDCSARVCRLKRALYGLRQAPRAWHVRLKAEVEQLGFATSAADLSLFTMVRGNSKVLLAVYVDEGDDETMAMEIVRDRAARVLSQGAEPGAARVLSQERYAAAVVDRFGLANARSKATPLSTSQQLDREGEVVLRMGEHSYAGLVGSLVHLAVCTRPDIAHVVEAEYVSASAAAKEALWLRVLLADLSMGSSTVEPVTIMCDDEAAITLIKHPIASVRSKDIDVLHHFVREHAAGGELVFKYLASGANVANAMTKALPGVKFEFCKSGMGMVKL